jgi:putative nucleotidyltransferase with HDIG domain
VNRISLSNLVNDVHRLPSLPAVVQELLIALDKDDVNVEELLHGVEQDQTLSARVLRVANSPFYGMTKSVASIQDAIVILGLKAVKSLVVTAAIIDTLKLPPMAWFDQATFWRHSLATAVCARHLAGLAGFNPDIAYTAGLLHDIGRLLLIVCYPEPYRLAVARKTELDCMLVDAEREVLGLSHMEAGEALASHWRFAPVIRDAVSYHHSPPQVDNATLTDVIHCADLLAHALDMEHNPDTLVGKIDEAAWGRLNLDLDKLADSFHAIETEYQSYDSFMQP